MNKHKPYTRSLRSSLAAFATAMMLSLSPTASALTPDGETPANEGVCDVLQGGTPGLYGLCVAYCEAQDLDLVGDKPAPNARILDNYRKKMVAGDPDMPCIQVPCPCWTAEQLANVGSSGVPTCNVTSDIARVLLLAPGVFQQATTDMSASTCRFVDTTTTPAISLRFDVSGEQAQSCYNQINDKCTALGQ